MSSFNGNAEKSGVVYVPAAEFLDVANVIASLVSAPNAVPIGDLVVAVREGELQLGDATGSYGVRVFRAP